MPLHYKGSKFHRVIPQFMLQVRATALHRASLFVCDQCFGSKSATRHPCCAHTATFTTCNKPVLYCRVATSPAATVPVASLSMARNLLMKPSSRNTPGPTYCPWPTLALTPTDLRYVSSSFDPSERQAETACVTRSIM